MRSTTSKWARAVAETWP